MAKEIPYNQARFHLTVNDNQLAVVAFESKNFGISQDYQFDIRLRDQPDLDLLNQPAILTLNGKNGDTEIHGVITAIDNCTITMHSPLHPLKQQQNNRIFVNKTIDDVVNTILNGVQNFEPLHEKQNSVPLRIQKNQSDYDFLLQCLNQSGLFFTLLYITDNINKLPDWRGEQLLFRPITGAARKPETASAIAVKNQLLTQNIKLRDYNSNTPEQELIMNQAQNSAVTGFGDYYLYGQNYLDNPSGQLLAQNHQQALDWQRHVIKITTDCPDFLPGMQFNLVDSPYDGSYRVIEVGLHGENTGGGGIISTLWVIPADIPYKNPITVEKMHNLQTAQVTSPGGDYAFLENQGKYQARMPWGTDIPDLRLMQPYSGQDYGMHFPLQQTTEVLYTHINGDPHRPVLLGSVPNADNASPVTANNFRQNILRTWGGNEWVMDDTEAQEQFKLFTKDEQNLLHLDATAGAHKIALATEQGKMNIAVAKAKSQTSDNNNVLQIAKDHIINIKNAHQVQTQKQDINLESSQDLKFRSKQDHNLEAKTKDSSWKSGTNTIINAKTNSQISGDTITTNNKTNTYVKAQGINITNSNTISLAKNGVNISIDAQGNIIFQAPIINAKTKQNNLQSQQQALGGMGQQAGNPAAISTKAIADIAAINTLTLNLAKTKP